MIVLRNVIYALCMYSFYFWHNMNIWEGTLVVHYIHYVSVVLKGVLAQDMKKGHPPLWGLEHRAADKHVDSSCQWGTVIKLTALSTNNINSLPGISVSGPLTISCSTLIVLVCDETTRFRNCIDIPRVISQYFCSSVINRMLLWCLYLVTGLVQNSSILEENISSAGSLGIYGICD